jgi:hypothetical protein
VPSEKRKKSEGGGGEKTNFEFWMLDYEWDEREKG